MVVLDERHQGLELPVCASEILIGCSPPSTRVRHDQVQKGRTHGADLPESLELTDDAFALVLVGRSEMIACTVILRDLDLDANEGGRGIGRPPDAAVTSRFVDGILIDP